MRHNNGVVALSGGADSATLLYLALTECENLHAVSVNYGQTHIKELECARKLCKTVQVPHTIIDFDLTCFGGSPLTDKTLNVPAQSDNKQSVTVVPFRNTFLATICAAYCKQHNLNTIYMGATYEDLANYEDCRPVFFDALEELLLLGGTIHDLNIETPFIDTKKSEIIRLGYNKFSVPYQDTWTCYKGGDYPCLECDACRERIESFIVNGIRDPLITDESDWNKLKLEFVQNRK